MKTQHQNFTAFYQQGLKILLLLFLLSGNRSVQAQCPVNIDFELGNFTGWQCSAGSFSNGNLILAPTAPIPNQHEMLSSIPPTNLRDFYGNFPVNCPNGSGHSIKLGNSGTGAGAERVSFTFTIPPGQNQFNLIYNYAIVLNDNGHAANIQPRLTIEVKNLTDNTTNPCSSFDFIINSTLPGFFTSPFTANGAVVRCKNWSAASINLDGNAGKTIQITFTTTDCGAGGHFGYAYIDVNTECSSAFTGATYCPDDTSINVTAPFGYQAYTWWDAGFTTILGTSQTINFTPPPPPGTQIAVVVDPYAGYGCRDTLFANLVDTLTIQSQAGPDQLSCNKAPVQLGTNSRPGYIYSWSPATGLSNPNISNPVATPTATTQYVVTTSHEGGGCITTDTVIVSAALLDSSIQLIGFTDICLGQQSAVLRVNPADSIQWYRNNVAIPGANQTSYNVTQSGSYFATVFSFLGCSSNTAVKDIVVNPSPLSGFSTNMADQCFKNNQFIFTNSSTVSSGNLFYAWDLGDGITATSTDVIHSYAQPGTYQVKLLVTTDKGCKDSVAFTVHVFDSPVAGFTSNINSLCFKDNKFVFTNTSSLASGNLLYNWNMGDGNTFVSKDITYSYSQPGSYIVKLLVTTDKGCTDSASFNIDVNPSPVPGFTVNNAQQCFGNNQFIFTNSSTILWGTLQYDWSLGDGASDTTANVTHSYSLPGNYYIRMLVTSDKGCRDSSATSVGIYPYPFADYLVKQPACINQEVLIVNKTLNNTASAINYLWDFGNGQRSGLRSPAYSYPAAGNFNLSLSVSTVQCPQTFTTKIVPIVIEAPAPGIVYPEKDAVYNFPERLQARAIGNAALWTPATSLDNRFSYNPTFRGITAQLYTIELQTASGCITVDTQLVKTHKKIEIYVPTVFTPTGDGLNDYLRPLLMGFAKVNYFRVYNRWGKLLFQMQSDRPGWDGRVNGQAAEPQTVVWMIEAVDVDGEVHRRQGTTVLIR